MASRHVAEFLGLSNSRGTIAPGQLADLLVLDNEQQVLASYIGGVDVDATASFGHVAPR